MSVELELIFGSRLDHRYDNMADYHAKYGEGLIEIARVKLSSVDDSVWDVVNKYREQAKAEKAETGHFNVIYTHAVVEVEEFNLSEDKYGEPVAMIPLAEIRDAIQGAEASRGYRRYTLALAMIAILEQEFASDILPLYALTYGY
jgi:hypothetical protein